MILEVMMGVFFALAIWKIIEIIAKKGDEMSQATKMNNTANNIAKGHVKNIFDKAIKELAKEEKRD